MAHSNGTKNVELVVVGDDVSVPRSRNQYVGRRCLAGITLGKSATSTTVVYSSWKALANDVTVLKILGAASEADTGFDDIVNLGRSVSSNIGSICAALDHCHVPGRSGDWQIPEGRIEIGLGLHNETVSFNSMLDGRVPEC